MAVTVQTRKTGSRNAAARAAIYARISSDDLRDGLGVERQLDDLRRYCKREGWHPVEFVDNDFGASTYSRRKRPQFDRMLEAVKARDVDVVLVMELSRFTRDPAVVEGLIRAQDRGVRLVSVQGGEYDPESATGKLRLRTEAMVAASYADFVSDKVRRKKLELVEAGKGPGGSRAFGYLGADPKIGRRVGTVIDKREAAAYRKAANDVLAGASLASIARRWNDVGFRTPRTGSLWGVPSVRATLTNPRHAGLLARSVTRDGRRVYDVIGPAEWPAIIDKATHDRLVRLLLDPDRRRKNPPRRGLLTGLLYCGRCGGPLRSDGTYYGCRPVPEAEPVPCGHNTIRADKLNELIVAAVLYRLNSPKVAKALTKKPKRATKGEDPADLERELEGLASMYGSGELSAREWRQIRPGIEERLTQARAATEALAGSPAVEAIITSGDTAKAWDALSMDGRRAIVSELAERITVAPRIGARKTFDPDRVDVRWKV